MNLRCLALLPALFAVAPAAARPAMSLNGVWQFRLDMSAGAEWRKPPEAAAEFPDTIQVPGCWEVQGFGKPTDRMRHLGVGIGWYRREFELPAGWAGKRVWLRLGGVHRSVRVWMDGHLVGEHWGYPTACKWEMTAALAHQTKHTLILAVDSRPHPDRDPLTGTFDLIDYVNIDWGGIYADVTLEVTADVWMEEAFVIPEPEQDRATVKVTLGGKTGATDLLLGYTVTRWPTGARTLAAGEAHVRTSASTLTLRLGDAPRWSPASPSLLRLNLSLSAAGTVLDDRQVRFGLRRVTIRGSDFFLNGSRFFLRGYGDDNTLPVRLVPPADREFWRRYLQRRKAFGFNAVRHHSMMPTEAYLAAADEVGMFVQPELPIAYQPFFQRATAEGRDLYRQVWQDYIRQRRNHPSVFAWCMGNELWRGFALGPELYAMAKRLDPTRPVIDTDGVPVTDRPTLDYLSVQFQEHILPWGTHRNKYRLAKPPAKPVVVHEMSNLSTLPDPAAARRYTGPLIPFWLHTMGGRVKQQRLASLLPRMLTASHRLQAQLLKLNLEAARLSPGIDGYYQWLFRDYWTQSSGFVNQFDDVRQITPAFALRFNGPAVLLLDRGRVNFTPGDTIPVRLFVSDFRPGRPSAWDAIQVRCGDQPVTLAPPPKRTGPGLLGPWTGKTTAPAVDSPRRLTLAAQADEVRNEWSVWVFPPTSPDLTSGERSRLIVHLSERSLTEVEKGAARMLVGVEGVLPTLNTTFKPAWWHGNENADHSYGKLFTSTPALGALPHRGFGDLMMFSLLDNRPVVKLDELPARIDPLVWDLDVPWRMRRKAYLFEARVGEGKLLVSTFNLTPANRRTDPAAAWLLHRLLLYVGSDDFHPTAQLPVDWLRQRMRKAAFPDPATFVNGFTRVVKTTEPATTWYSYREDDTLSFPVRQTDGKQRLTWQTEPVPDDWPHEVVTFVWTGGMGWRTEPGGGHFSLLLNGAPLLDFPFTQKTTRWQTADGAVTFHYLVKRRLGPDSFGLFYLTVPVERLLLGKPVELTVTATAQNSHRWFSVNPYPDTLEYEAW